MEGVIGEIVRLTAYYLLFIIIPGWWLARMICPAQEGRAWRFHLAIVAGYVMESILFIGLSAYDVRAYWVFYPLPFALATVYYVWRYRTVLRPAGLPRWGALTAAAVVALYLALFSLKLFSTPYSYQDVCGKYENHILTYTHSIVEAKNHWPMLNPNLAGMPGPGAGQWLTYYHPAAVLTVTGIEPYRWQALLEPYFTGAWFLVLLYHLGREATGQRASAALAVILILILGYCGMIGFTVNDFALYNYAAFFGVIFFLMAIRAWLRYREQGWSRKGFAQLLLILAASAIAKDFVLYLFAVVVILDAGVHWWRTRARAGIGRAAAVVALVMLVLAGTKHASALLMPLVATSAGRYSGAQLRVLGFLRDSVPADSRWRSVERRLVKAGYEDWTPVAFTGMVALKYAQGDGFKFAVLILLAVVAGRRHKLHPLEIAGMLALLAGAGVNAMIFTSANDSYYAVCYAEPLAILPAARGVHAIWQSRARGVVICIAVALAVMVMTTMRQDLPLLRQNGLTDRNADNAVFRGLFHLRRVADADAVCAVNNLFPDGQLRVRDDASRVSDRAAWIAVYPYTVSYHYAAISERRFVLATIPHGKVEATAERYRDMMLLYGNPDADTFRRVVDKYGISYILVDKVRDVYGRQAGFPAGSVGSVYASPDLDIYEVIEWRGAAAGNAGVALEPLRSAG